MFPSFHFSFTPYTFLLPSICLVMKGGSCISFLLVLATIVVCIPSAASFHNAICKLHRPSALLLHTFDTLSVSTSTSQLNSAAPSDNDSYGDVPVSVNSASERVDECKRSLIQQCTNHELGSGYSSNVEGKIKELEQLGEDAGFGQASSLSGLMSGEW